MTEEANRLIKTIRQMEASLDDSKPNPNYDAPDGREVTYPLTRCLKELKEKYNAVSRLHRERFEQVRSTHLRRPYAVYILTRRRTR
jgi:protein regulator of cytokinesis 1